MPASPEKRVFNATRILFFVLTVGQLLFAGIVFLLRQPLSVPTVDFGDRLILIAIVVTLAAVGASAFMDSRQRNNFKQGNLLVKLHHQKTSMLFRVIPLESASMLNLIFVFLTGNTFFFLTFSLSMFYFFMARPTIEGLKRDYQLTKAEEQLLIAN